MKGFQFDCGKCKKTVELPLIDSSFSSACPKCGTEISIDTYPALLQKDAPGRAGELVVLDDQSSCFFHPSKKAVAVCEACGRFLCSLCEIEMGGRRLCSTCIERGAAKGKIERLESTRVRYDDIALSLAVLPIFFIWISFITATAALFVAVRYWKAPRSLVRPNRWKFVVAIVVSFLELMGWGYFGVEMLTPLF